MPTCMTATVSARASTVGLGAPPDQDSHEPAAGDNEEDRGSRDAAERAVSTSSAVGWSGLQRSHLVRALGDGDEAKRSEAEADEEGDEHESSSHGSGWIWRSTLNRQRRRASSAASRGRHPLGHGVVFHPPTKVRTFFKFISTDLQLHQVHHMNNARHKLDASRGPRRTPSVRS